jgi:hypothetical protein
LFAAITTIGLFTVAIFHSFSNFIFGSLCYIFCQTAQMHKNGPKMIVKNEPKMATVKYPNFKYFKGPQKINHQQARWIEILAHYDFEL